MSGVCSPLQRARTGGPPSRVVGSPAAASPADADAEMVAADEGDGPLDPASMTVAEIKAWLTDNEHEAAVWQLIQSKAKKAEFVKYMRSVM